MMNQPHYLSLEVMDEATRPVILFDACKTFAEVDGTELGLFLSRARDSSRVRVAESVDDMPMVVVEFTRGRLS